MFGRISPMKNPFLSAGVFPDFANITPEAAREALPVLIKSTSESIDRLEKDAPAEWDGLIRAMDDATRPLWHAWGLIAHMTSVMNSDAWRKVEEDFQGDIVSLSLRIGQSRRFYELEKELLGKTSDPTRRRILEKAIQGAEHSGVALEGEARERFNAIQTELAKVSNDFSNCVLDATKAFSLTVTDESDVDGLPENIKKMIKTDEGWRLTIEDAVYVPAMKHLKNRSLRERLCRARSTRAPENTARIDRLLALKSEIATLLGFGSYAELSVSTKSAPGIPAVMKMIDDLSGVAKPVSVKEREDLEAFAKSKGFEGESLEPWDLSFWAERLREERYAYSEEELSKYFNFEDVLKGAFSLAERLFGVQVEKADGEAPVWHRDVRFFRVKDLAGATLAHFYFDPYSRPETKRGGAWMNSFETLRVGDDGKVILPLALLVCNQALPDERGICLMNFREVETLFHEFGHSLQHMLTRIDEESASGLGLVEWDAVEIASQFMENWCVDQKTVGAFARHVDTHEPIPAELIEKVRKAKTFRAANFTLRQLSFAKTDMILHGAQGPLKEAPNDVKTAIFTDFCPGATIAEDRFLESFTHIFAGGYSAGYYSYMWSEVMSADAFGAFEEAGLDDEAAVIATGRRYRETILANGGSKPAMETFREFRGRLPEVDALLRHLGLK